MKRFEKFLFEFNGERTSSYVASSGFQWRFCRRFGIKHLANSGEKLASNKDAAAEFIEDFSSVTEMFDFDQNGRLK